MRALWSGGKHSDKAIEVRAAGMTHVFDSFQCAMQLMAPMWTPAGAGRWVTGSCPMAGSPERGTCGDRG
jgi:hypothetical protein